MTMSNISIRMSDGAIAEVTMLKFFSLLADEHSYRKVLSELNETGLINVELKSGPAQAWRTDHHPLLPTEQHALPMQTFTIDAVLKIYVPARIFCDAGSPAEAGEMTAETIRGHQGMPSRFAINVNGNAVDAMLASIPIGQFSGVELDRILHIDPWTPSQRSLPAPVSSP
jgi:hypothetical protein